MSKPRKSSRRKMILETAALAAALASCEKCAKPPAPEPPKPTPAPTPQPTAAATPAAPPPAPTPTPVAALPAGVDKRPFKLGLIGCGRHATMTLMPAALRLPGVTFTAVCDIIPARAAEAQKIAGGKAKVYDDYKVMLKEADVDGVMVVTPPVFHRPIVEEAFKNGRHVFCEAIMGLTIDDCQAMLKASAGKVFQIGHHLRYHPLYPFAKRHYISKNQLVGDKVNNIRCHWNRNAQWRRPVEQVPGVDFKKWGYENADEFTNWRLYRKYSAGLLSELASHQLDVASWFLEDAMPDAVVAVGRIDKADGRTNYDNIHLAYEFPNNVQVTYESLLTDSFSPFGEAYELFQGVKGTLVMAHLSKYNGLFFLEPGVGEELWMPAAHKADFDLPNFTRKDAKGPIILNGIPSPGDNTEKVANVLLIREVVDQQTCLLTMTPYEIEIYGFKTSVLDQLFPYCNAKVAFKAAVMALLGLEAMEKNQRIVVPDSLKNI